MKHIETDSHGNPIQKITVEHAIRDLLDFPPWLVIALCASFIAVHESSTWAETYKKFKKDLKV